MNFWPFATAFWLVALIVLAMIFERGNSFDHDERKVMIFYEDGKLYKTTNGVLAEVNRHELEST